MIKHKTYMLKNFKMLNLFKIKLNKQIAYFFSRKNKRIGDNIGKINYYPSANIEWFNSVYSYNKNSTKLLSIANKTTLKLLKNYFNIYSRKLEKKIKSLFLRIRLRKLSTNKVLVSKAELKHTNNKVVITTYLYNRQKKYYTEKLKKSISTNKLRFFNRKLKIKNLVKKSLHTYKKVIIQKSIFFKIHRQKINKYNNYENVYWKNFITKTLLKEIYIFQLNKLIYINKCKFENTYLLPFTHLIKKIYKKNIQFNLVSLKYLYLNSYILTHTLVLKIRKYRKNRLLKVMKYAINMFRLPLFERLPIYNEKLGKNLTVQNLIINHVNINNNSVNSVLKSNDSFNHILHILYPNNHSNLSLVDKKRKNVISNSVLNSIKHKSITGIRIQASGRLTRRNTAARSVSKVRYNGNLKNIASSVRGFSSVLFRGYSKSNLQYTKLGSKIRIGTFGLKGWISSN